MTTPLRRPELSHRAPMLLLSDAVSHVLSAADLSATDTRELALALRAVRSACENIVAYKQWKCYQSTTRVRFNGRVTRTVDYSASTGIATIVSGGGTWPDWAAYGELRIGKDEYSVIERVSNTQIKLSQTTRPTADLTAQVSTLLQRRAPLPNDFRACNQIFEVNDEYEVTNVGMGAAFEWESKFNETNRDQDVSTVTGDPRFYGLALQMAPSPSADTTFKLSYHRFPRTPRIWQEDATFSISGTTITTPQSFFSDRHVGSVIRLPADGETVIADSLQSSAAISDERIIVAVSSGTSATLDQPTTLASAKALVSDPIDCIPGPMAHAILALADWEFAQASKSKHVNDQRAKFMEYLHLAMGDDQRYTGPMSGQVGVAMGRSLIGEVNTNP